MEEQTVDLCMLSADQLMMWYQGLRDVMVDQGVPSGRTMPYGRMLWKRAHYRLAAAAESQNVEPREVLLRVLLKSSAGAKSGTSKHQPLCRLLSDPAAVHQTIYTKPHQQPQSITQKSYIDFVKRGGNLVKYSYHKAQKKEVFVSVHQDGLQLMWGHRAYAFGLVSKNAKPKMHLGMVECITLTPADSRSSLLMHVVEKKPW
jgi:hypothetical protein